MDQETSSKVEKRGRWREMWPFLIVGIVYMIPLFGLWSQTGFPDDFGIHITAHGKTGLLENWWYSYLLLQRHRLMDGATFAYMWVAVVGIVAWFGWTVAKNYRTDRMTGSSDAATRKDDAA